jgi:hypothetical protein
MKAVQDLHRLWGPLANAVCIRGLRSRQTTVMVGCWASLAATIAAEGHADGLQERDQPVGFAGGWRDEVWKALRKDAAPAARIPTHELPHYESDADGAKAPREVRHMALRATMDRG